MRVAVNELAPCTDPNAAHLDTTHANLQDFLPLPQAERSLCALDLGCGTGATAVRLARLGIHVTLLDSSAEMLDIAKSAAQEAGLRG